MYFICPDCNITGHLRIDTNKYATESEWLKALHPDTKPGEMPLVRCLMCWKKKELDEASKR